MKHFASKKLLMGALLVSVSLLLSVQASAQKKNVTISANQITVANLIKEVEKQTDYLFVYNEKDVNLGQTVSVNANNESAVSVLSKALAGTGVTPKVEGTNIVLSKTNATAENKAVTGTILDEKGEPVVGASVLVKGTTNGASTDIDGKFSINAPANAVLVCSSIGFVPQEIAVSGRNNINVALATDTEILDDVIVIGYGTAKKRDYIGSVSTIKAEDVMKTNPTSVESALQGMAAGVQVNNAIGVPGAPMQVKVRGVSSISCATDPLWIVDGIPVQSGAMDTSYDGETQQSVIGMLNPNDIESIQVLKDAAATAIYGSRASNGVILVTTKSGQKGNVKVNVDLKGGLSTWAHSDIGLANTSEWFQIADMAAKNTLKSDKYDINMTYTNLDGDVNQLYERNVAETVNTNWADAISRTGSFYEANVSISGGSEKLRSYASLKYRKDNGNLKFNDLSTFAGNVKLDWDICKWFDISYRMAATYTDNNRIKSSDGKAGSGGWAQVNSNALPWYKIYNEGTVDGYWNSLSSVNALASMDPVNMNSNVKTMNLTSALVATVHLPVDGLSLKGEWGVNYVNSIGESYRSGHIRVDGTVARENKNTVLINNYNAYLDYTKAFNENHEVSAVLGVENTRKIGSYTDLTGKGLVGPFHEIGTPTILSGSSKLGGEEYMRSFFFRANYKLMNRYIINFSARRDGNSKFSADHRWANFFAGGLGWVISDEPWFNSNTINLLKLRGSVGQTGNANIPSNTKDDYWVIKTAPNNLCGFNVTRLDTIGNPDIKWETTTAYDAGVDFGFFHNRLNGSIAYYRQNVTDMISRVSMPFSAGIYGGNYWQNIGNMCNQGVELELMGTIMQRKNFTWTAGFNVSYNTNKVTALDPLSDASGAGILNAGDGGQFRTIIKTGLPYGTYCMAEYAGVDAQKGIPMIYEVKTNADGTTEHTGNIIPATSDNISANQMILAGKSALPKVVGGFNTTLKFYGFDVYAQFAFAAGQYAYSRLLQSSFTPNAGMMVMNKALLTDSWKNPGDVTDVPQVNAKCVYFYDNEGAATTSEKEYGSENKTPTSRFLYKADYLKLRNLTIGYTLPAKATQKAKIQNVRFYISGGNLFTLTPFPGYDPELTIDQMTGGAVEVFTSMPSTRTYTFGVNLNF